MGLRVHPDLHDAELRVFYPVPKLLGIFVSLGRLTSVRLSACLSVPSFVPPVVCKVCKE